MSNILKYTTIVVLVLGRMGGYRSRQVCVDRGGGLGLRKESREREAGLLW